MNMKRHITIALLVMSFGLAGCSHHRGDRGGTYTPSGTYQGTESDWDRGESSNRDKDFQPDADSTQGRDQLSPVPTSPENDQEFER